MTTVHKKSYPFTVRVPRIDGLAGLEDVTVTVEEGEKHFTSAFGVGRYWWQHDEVFLSGQRIGHAQRTNRKNRPSLTSPEGEGCCVIGYDIAWLVRTWREKHGGRQGRLDRIAPGACYRVAQTFGLTQASTKLGVNVFTDGLNFTVTEKNSSRVAFRWGPVFDQAIRAGKHPAIAGMLDDLEASMFEQLVENRSFVEIPHG